MERRIEGEEVGRGGAGGKLAKRSFRTRVQPTPYDRPPRGEAQPHQQRKKTDGWLSKLLVQPASRILPSLFSNHQDSPPPEPLPLLESEQEDCDAVATHISDNHLFESKEPGASAEYGQPKVSPKGDELVGDQLGNAHDGCVLAEIEQRLKQKMFTRDESKHLIELLRSRTTDLPNDDEVTAGYTLEAPEGTLGQIGSRISTKEEHGVQSDCQMTWKTYPLQFTPHSVSSSPVEIAKSYMEDQTSAYDYNSQSGRLKNEKIPLSIDNSASRLSFTSAAKSPIRWPGAVVQRDHGYFTTQRGRIGLRDFPRTPYSGSVFSKSTSKLQGGEEKPICSSQSTTHIFGGNTMRNRSSSVLDDDYTSVGPIRRVRQKDMSTSASKGIGSSNLTRSFILLSNSSDALNRSSSTIQGNLEHGSSNGSFCKFQATDTDDEASRFTARSLTVRPQSSEMARKILEHLDRTVPSPKEKSLELKLAVTRSKVPPKSATIVINGQENRPDVNFSDYHKNGFLLGKNMVVQESADAQKVLPGPSTSKFNDKDQLSALVPQTDKQGILGLVHSATDNSAVFQIPNILPHSSCESLSTSISTVKPNEKLKSCDNGFNFSFAVPAASDVFSEPPPTPTMTPSLSASKMLEASEGSIPAFNFDSSRAGSRLVFSFGSIDSSSSITDTTYPNFKFGSEKKRCLFAKSSAMMPIVIKNY